MSNRTDTPEPRGKAVGSLLVREDKRFNVVVDVEATRDLPAGMHRLYLTGCRGCGKNAAYIAPPPEGNRDYAVDVIASEIGDAIAAHDSGEKVNPDARAKQVVAALRARPLPADVQAAAAMLRCDIESTRYLPGNPIIPIGRRELLLVLDHIQQTEAL